MKLNDILKLINDCPEHEWYAITRGECKYSANIVIFTFYDFDGNLHSYIHEVKPRRMAIMIEKQPVFMCYNETAELIITALEDKFGISLL